MNDDTRDASGHDPDAKHDERGGRDVTTRDRIEHQPNPDERGTRLSAAIGLLGLWLVVQAVWLNPAPGRFWNAVLVGGALLAVGAYNFHRRANEEFGSAGVATFAALLGLWLVASPLLFGGESGTAAAAAGEVVVGLLAVGFGTYSAVAIRNRRKEADARSTATYDRTGQ
ncbi:SPW repeat domain-containing protein [Natronococcus wangiae]|uniref:SPW repeat domain-containing protein n=1 Tax=Natronococcus wangiae TaxID=3068275 RepID=UPI00273E3E1B|nr:SPW repeat protein [Natronococcus sp. AD5]